MVTNYEGVDGWWHSTKSEANYVDYIYIPSPFNSEEESITCSNPLIIGHFNAGRLEDVKQCYRITWEMGLLNMQLPWNGFIFKNWLLFLLPYILAKYESLNVLQLSLCIPSQRYWWMDETITQNKHIDLLTYLSQILPKLWPWPPPHFLPQSPEKKHVYKQITSINPKKAWKGMKKTL